MTEIITSIIQLITALVLFSLIKKEIVEPMMPHLKILKPFAKPSGKLKPTAYTDTELYEREQESLRS